MPERHYQKEASMMNQMKIRDHHWSSPWLQRQAWHFRHGVLTLRAAAVWLVVKGFPRIPRDVIFPAFFAIIQPITFVLIIALFGGTAFLLHELKPWLIVFPVVLFVVCLISWFTGFIRHESVDVKSKLVDVYDDDYRDGY